MIVTLLKIGPVVGEDGTAGHRRDARHSAARKIRAVPGRAARTAQKGCATRRRAEAGHPPNAIISRNPKRMSAKKDK